MQQSCWSLVEQVCDTEVVIFCDDEPLLVISDAGNCVISQGRSTWVVPDVSCSMSALGEVESQCSGQLLIYEN